MRERNAKVNGVLMLLVYGIFALFSLLLVVVGARVYRNIVSASQRNTQTRAAFSYVAGKLRMSGQTPGSLEIREEKGTTILVLDAQTEGYETRIFYYDGALRELYQASEQEFIPEMGEKIVEVSDFRMDTTEEGNLLLEAVDLEGRARSLHLYVEGKGYE